MKLLKTKYNSRGFTLIELLVVSTIIVVLSAIGLVSFVNAGKSARNAKRKSDLETVRQALVLYKSEEGSYPTSNYDVAIIELSSKGYISDPTPVDPKNGVFDCGINSDEQCGYAYSGTTTEFTLTASLEGEANYEVSNP